MLKNKIIFNEGENKKPTHQPVIEEEFNDTEEKDVYTYAQKKKYDELHKLFHPKG